MKPHLRTLLLVALGLSVPALAAAQKGKGDKKPLPTGDEEGDGQEVELQDDPPPEDMEGTAENPDAPRLPGQEDEPDVVVPEAKRTGYPTEEVLRPLTLPAVTSEVGLDVRSYFDGLNAEIGVRARYGITRQVQLGLRYLVGGYFDDPTTVGDDKMTFATGKAVGLDVTYAIFDWVAARVTIPVYVDPFAMAITLGAPMKFRFGEKLAIVAVDDFLDIRVVEFVPSLYNEQENVLAVEAIETNDTRTNANIHLRAGVIYQLKPDMAIRGNVRQSFLDTSDSDQPTALEGLIQFSPSNKMDVVGRIGFDRLDEATETFALMIAAAYRI